MSKLEGPKLVLLSRDPKEREELCAHYQTLKGQFQNLIILPMETKNIPDDGAQLGDVLVVASNSWDPLQESMINGLRDRGYKGPILILAKREKGARAPATPEFETVVFLDKPYDHKEMLGCVQRMLIAPVIAARRFPRHETNEDAEMQIEGQALVVRCLVKNMSKGGAFIDAGRALHVRIGDVVVLKIRLGKVRKEYALRARVAWVNNRNSGLGIEFVVALGGR